MTDTERSDYEVEPSRVREARITEGMSMSKRTPLVLVKGLLVVMLRDADPSYDIVISHMMKLLV